MESAKIFAFFLLSVLFVFTEQAATRNEEFINDAYYYEQAIIVREFNKKNDLKECDISLHYDPEEFKNYSAILFNLTLIEPKLLSFKDFNEKKKECNKLDKDSKLNKTTRWCGVRTSTESYHYLGTDRDTDRCCRDHTVCPFKIANGDTRYGLTNEASVTRLLCSCEREYYKCLSNTTTGNTIKDEYFSRATDCIKGIPNEDNELSFEKTIQQQNI